MLRPRTAAVASLLLLPMAAGGFLLQGAPARTTPRLFEQVLSIVATRYVDSLQEPAIFEKAARGLVRELNDPYSELLAPKANEEFNRSVGGRYGGVGMLLEEQKNTGPIRVVVNRVFPHTPAEEGGVLEGDQIVTSRFARRHGRHEDRQRVQRAARRRRNDGARHLRAAGCRRADQALVQARHHSRARRAVRHDRWRSHRLHPAPDLQREHRRGSQAAAAKLVSQGAKGLVLDLRDNGGGIVEQSLAVSSLFLKEGQPIVNVRGRNTPDEIARASNEHLAAQPPLVILTDGNTASASEIVAGALQDHDRALVLGTTSFGKGLVQSLFPLDGGYALKITTGKWYTPSGRSIHRERKLLADGRLVETKPDSLETEAEKQARPAFKSDAGRIVYGGGGITPDVIVPDDTLSTAEQEFYRATSRRRRRRSSRRSTSTPSSSSRRRRTSPSRPRGAPSCVAGSRPPA